MTFSKQTQKERVLFGGGHKLIKFHDIISQYPLKLVKDIDINKETAPTIYVANDFLTNVGLPIWDLLNHFFSTNYRFIFKLVQWKYRRKIEKISRKYFKGARNGDNFKLFKNISPVSL